MSITLEKYMETKFPNGRVRALSFIESKIFEIEMTKGWFKRNKDKILTQRQINAAVNHNGKNKSVPNARKCRLRELVKEYVDWSGQYVYFMKNEVGRLKIGISKDPIQRAWNLSTSSGLYTEVINYYAVSKEARDVEAYLLNHFKKSATLGEWFREGSIATETLEAALSEFCKFKKFSPEFVN